MREVVLMAMVVAGLGGAADTSPIWTGAYTAAQAARGKTQFEVYCATCHNDDLSGRNGPALASPVFLTNWDAATVSELFGKIRKTMPRGAAPLADDVYLDVIAYILQRNGFPAGSSELRSDSPALTSTQIVGRDGPMPAENGQLVRTVGCFTAEASGRAWTLTSATPPTRSRTGDPSSESERMALDSAPLGAGQFRLLAVTRAADAHRGHKMEAKGLLNGGTIAVTSLEMVSASCQP
jgi:mono/diheme cytochrome c family protein